MSLMNFTTAVFLINDKARAIKVNYDPADTKRDGQPTGYTFKTFDQTIKKDDIVVVPTDTRHGYTCVKVSEVDVHIPLNDTIEYKWIVAKVDLDAYRNVLQLEEDIVGRIRTNQIAKERKKLAADLLGEEQGELSTAPIAMLGHDVVEPPKR